MLLLLAITCLPAVLGYSTSTVCPMRPERNLWRDLFSDYNKFVRPVEDPTTVIRAEVGIQPIHVRELDEKQQVLVLETFTKMKWHDEYLRWDPAEYKNISILRVPSDHVWKPDLSVYTSSFESSLFPSTEVQVLVYSNGTVLWVPMFTIRSRCPTQREKDYVECNIKIGSWTFSGYELDVVLHDEQVDIKDFVDTNPDWKLVSIKSDRQDTYYPCCAEPYPSVNFNVTLRRRSNPRTIVAESGDLVEIQF